MSFFVPESIKQKLQEFSDLFNKIYKNDLKIASLTNCGIIQETNYKFSDNLISLIPQNKWEITSHAPQKLDLCLNIKNLSMKFKKKEGIFQMGIIFQTKTNELASHSLKRTVYTDIYKDYFYSKQIDFSVKIEKQLFPANIIIVVYDLEKDLDGNFGIYKGDTSYFDYGVVQYYITFL